MAIYKLGEIGRFRGGFSSLNKNLYDSGVDFINYLDVFKNPYIDENIYLRKYNANENEIKKFSVNYGDAIFTASSEIKNEIALSSIYLNNKPNIVNGFCKIYKYDQSILLPKFASYLFRSKEFRKEVIRYATGFTRYNISILSLEQIKIDIPPLETQKSIIDIIETHEELFLKHNKLVRINNLENTKKDIQNLIDIIEPLEKEKKLVNKQKALFKKFKNQHFHHLFESIDKKLKIFQTYILDEILTFESGDSKMNFKWVKENKGIYPFYSSKTIDEKPIAFINTYNYDGEFITVSGSGEKCGKVFYRKNKFSIMQRVWLIKNNQNIVLNKYLYYILKSKENELNVLGRKSTAQPNINKTDLQNFTINIPPLKLQNSLISIISI
ncbi:restriction endonuclease subunit S [[Mycoplasma] collis]|uniref:restriction endonuclease subunit S n=1 Tax=[Mycoplasma] collis TaxID=2127 RepID=UPI000691F0B2|nr:restriction endonuclease subunit S [[Mycoplasma] collis]